MSRDVITVGLTMRIPLLYRGEYSQWSERFMNYLEEQTDGEAMINSIRNGEQPLPIIDRLVRSLLIQGLPNDIYSLIYRNNTAKDLWDALERQMRGSEYVINDLKKCGYKKDNCELNYKFLNDLQPEWKQYGTLMREKVVVQSESEGSYDEDISDLKKIITLLAKAFNRKKYYAKPTNNNLRTSSASSSANKKPEYVKSEVKKEDKKADEKKRDMSKLKCYNCKKEGHFTKDCKKAKVKDYNYYKTKMLLAKKDSDEQVLLVEDEAWMKSSNSEKSSSSAEETIAESEVDHKDFEVKDHLVDKLIKNFNQKIAKCKKRIEKANQQSKDLENQNKDLQDKYDVLKNQVSTFEEKNNAFNEQIKVLNENNDDLLAQSEVLQEQIKVKHVVIDTHTECQAQYAKLEEERYEYMIKYSALCDNDKQHRKKIDEQEILIVLETRKVSVTSKL
ncbi:integrase, catalytic region, zinc finger, CCHC-type containing protein [Tanacetum coccineum]